MGAISVKVMDVSGSRSTAVQAPDDVPVDRIIVLLVERLRLPISSPDGQVLSYKLHHRRTGRQLLDSRTLADSGVAEGDELRLQPEITAGRALTQAPRGQEPPLIVLGEGRFARLHAIEWWDHNAVQAARVLVVGAGALGNEVIKNLSLLGIGHLTIVDRDRIELSNLCRSVLFRESDAGQSKALCAAAAARSLHPDGDVVAIDGDALADVGLGWFRWADVVVGALDNREARLFVNAACARVGTPWIDGGIEALRGVVRGFAPPGTACYQCTMGRTDWAIVNQRRSCSLLARRAAEQGGVPTTPTAASLIGALQAQEVLRIVHGMDALLGRGIVHDAATWLFEHVAYELDPDCEQHDALPQMVDDHGLAPDARLQELWAVATDRLGGCDALVLSREIIESVHCPDCDTTEMLLCPLDRIAPARLACPRCEGERIPRALLEIDATSPLLSLRVPELGLPALDITWARRGTDVIGLQVDPFAPSSRPVTGEGGVR